MLQVHNKKKAINKRTVVSQLEVLSWNIPGGTWEDHESLSEDIQSANRDLKPGLPTYETRLNYFEHLCKIVTYLKCPVCL
jgi:hypothetical protein